MCKTLIVLPGPTGVGKTELSLRLAEYYNCPVLSADSRQLYRDLPIGTAAPTVEQQDRVPHYFVARLGLDEYYSAACYEEEAVRLLDELFVVHDVVLMTGGSMMYIDAVCKGIDEIPTVSEEVRKEVVAWYEREGLTVLCEELKRLDPLYYTQVDLKNPKRVIHAIEICRMAGKPYSELRTNKVKSRSFNIIKIGLNREREELYARINARVDAMMENGLFEEARKVYPFRNYNSLNTVGYKELFAYFDGIITLEQAIEKIKRNTRVYSRKQLTWFKRDTDIEWFSPDDEKAILSYLNSRL